MTIPDKIIFDKEIKIISPSVLSESIKKLVYEQNGSYKELIYRTNNEVNKDKIEQFVLFSILIIIYFMSNKKETKNISEEDFEKLLFYIQTNNIEFYDMCSEIRKDKNNFLKFYSYIVSDELELMLLESWAQIFSNVDEDMNAIRDISIGFSIGYEKAITIDVLKPAAKMFDSKRLNK